MVEAVRGDVELNERQKQALIDIYLLFRREHSSTAGGQDLAELSPEPVETGPAKPQPWLVRVAVTGGRQNT